jgi:hypothetical protein
VSAELITLADASQEAVDDELEARGWSDGLPVVAPTRERVEAMVAAGGRDGDDSLGPMPPRQGDATIEALAVNAVMAGCRPAYFPVVVAAVEAMLEPEFNLYAVQATTHPCSPLVIVNGPIATELGINSRYGAFGPGFRANATIGRAVRLILHNVGGGVPGVLDRATQGQPSKYSFCVAENEAESPWEPLHVERGHDRDRSTVTVVGCESPHNINDHVSNRAPGILATVASSMADMGANNSYLHGEPVLALGPEHAAILGAAGMSKQDIRAHLFDEARIPREVWRRGGMADMHPDNFPGDDAVPVMSDPDSLIIIVLGGFGRHSSWLPTFGDTTRSVTRPIPEQPLRR